MKLSSGATEAAFLLGGIGTGNFSVGSRGDLRDWELFNWPGKGNKLPFAFFAISERRRGRLPVVKVLESKIHPPYTRSHGFLHGEVGCLPRLEHSTMRGETPFVWVDFEDEELTVHVEMEAFTPLIPLDADDSGIPGAVIRYRVRNPSSDPVDVCIVGTLPNASGFDGYDVIGNLKLAAEVTNEWRDQDGLRGLFLDAPNLCHDDVRYGNLSIVTRDNQTTHKREWLVGEWVDGAQDFWDDILEDGRLEPDSSFDATGSEFAKYHDYSFLRQRERIASLGIHHQLEANQEQVFEYFVTWNFPNRVRHWVEFDEEITAAHRGEYPTVRNYYATKFADSWAVARYLAANLNRLETHSRNFQRSLYSSTLPEAVIEAAGANLNVLRSPTCFRIEDGTFLGYEGIRNDVGCGLGSVPHVWNYAQAVAFLFPDLEKSMRRVEFNIETDETGRMSTRMLRVLGQDRYRMVPAADGQLGSVVRAYREWKFTGDSDFLRQIWDGVRKAVDFAFEYWDPDHDFVLEAQQNTTYDIEFYGVNPLVSSLFYAALKAASEMAEFMGDQSRALKYRNAFEAGSTKADAAMFNGEYFQQRIENPDAYRYQVGKGCLSDQLFGQTLAHIVGLGHVFPEEHVRSALKAVFKHNFIKDFGHLQSVHRAYAMDGENGLILCSWPEGGRPRIPMQYSNEVWTGVEYQVAVNLIYEGLVDEGLRLVSAVRDRYDGQKRNPWSEVESGYHYVRSMGSWALVPALSGFRCDLVKGTMRFAPKINKEEFSVFWITGKAWGTYRQKRNATTGSLTRKVEVLYGDLNGIDVEFD